ncbi:hypothetical protein DY958_25255 [Pseudomonas aeruginosa]|uniref:hypothetical protein n=1 Tax=Pseudomonas aeruginosa TaxID=287 RepID=UPI000F82C6A2|nr:hypothetical protein [Pseudomonas aeruginosa]RTT41002.1 hypothetical protein DY958_25255 [Pseudomonas aeruginosa]
MGYKVVDGQANYLPSSIRTVYENLDYSPPAIVRTHDDILKSIECAREILASHKVKIRPGSSLDRIFANTSSRLRKKKPATPAGEVDTHFVAILASMIITFANEPGIKEVFERIAGSDVATSSRRQSNGKDMIWELTMLSNLRMSSIPSSLAEPDIIGDFGFGPYGLACKKIYSENSVEKAIRKGGSQLKEAHLRGLIAINLDDLLLPPNRVLYASSQDFLRHMLQDYMIKFTERHKGTLMKYAPSDYCDGYMIYLSATGYLLDTRCYLPVSVSIFSNSGKSDREHHQRVDALAKKLANADGLEDWVRQAGGKTENY